MNRCTLRRPGRLGRARTALLAAAAVVAQPAWSYTCSLSATTTAFGIYAPASASPNDTTGTITVTCSADVASLPITYTLALSAGGSGSYATRLMSAGAATLQYQLYADAARTSVWGDGTAGTGTVSGGFTLSVINSVSAQHTVYGRMPPLQSSAVAGTYSDLVVVTLSY